MDSKEIRQKFLDFFKKHGHTVVFSSSLIPSDPSVLFTTAGMQQFKPYYLGEKSPHGENAASCQKCLRTSDIDEVGDGSHLTFLEMLGNFSFAVSAEASGKGGEGYFKERAIKLAYDFLFKELKLSIESAFFTVFEGDEGDQNVLEDKESSLIWKGLGIKEDKIKKCVRSDNFWGPTGEEGPCGPTTEIHFNVGGIDIEVWNLVFNEYYQDKNKKLTLLKQKGIDTGMGLERLAMIAQNKQSVFETDLFWPIIQKIEELSGKPYSQNQKLFRIIADHIKASVFLIADGILPSNLEQGYVLRRLLRRAIRYGKLLSLPKNFLIPSAQKTIEIYKDIYPEVKSKENDILTAIQNEEEKFEKTFKGGIIEAGKLFERIRSLDLVTKKAVNGKDFFNVFQTHGFPLEMIFEEIEKKAKTCNYNFDDKYNKEDILREFDGEMKKHQEISRAGVEKKFGGHAAEKAETEEDKIKITKFHTATHLLHRALRDILGEHVRQMGSDINPERLRFDFAHAKKMTAEELKKVEELVNQKIKEDLKVVKEEMSYGEAMKSGALAFAFFSARGGSALGGKERYPEKVNVYTIGNWSKEICAGPHVEKTGQIGTFKITKEESCQAGVRRIKAVLN